MTRHLILREPQNTTHSCLLSLQCTQQTGVLCLPSSTLKRLTDMSQSTVQTGIYLDFTGKGNITTQPSSCLAASQPPTYLICSQRLYTGSSSATYPCCCVITWTIFCQYSDLISQRI